MNKIILQHHIALLLMVLLPIEVFSQIIVKDRFDRTLNDYQISLVDWEGHMHNPYIAINLYAPPNETFPLNVNLSALGSNRLLMDLPSLNLEQGATKTITFNNSNSVVRVLLEIAPDRVGGYGEIETYNFNMSYANKSEDIPIKVLDLDKDFNSLIPITFDYTHDNLTNYFTDPIKYPGFRECFEAAVNDWFYFFEYQDFDEVPAFEEVLNLAGTNWNENRVNATNPEPYKGHYVWARGIDGGVWSTGYASGTHHTIDNVKVAGPLPRSSTTLLHLASPLGANTDIDNTNYHLNLSIYGLLMHEFGHAIAFSSAYQGMNEIVGNGGNGGGNVERVNTYQGGSDAWGVDGNGYHVGGLDRLSGQSGGFASLFPTRMWMINKLTILIAENVGWKLRDDIGSLMTPQIETENNLPNGALNTNYNVTLTAKGGVPVYDWNVVSGTLPEGLSLNRFTGQISGVIDPNLPQGDYTFSVKLSDYDELAIQPTKQFTINVSKPCTVVTDVVFTEITESSISLTWNDDSEGDRRYIAYKAEGNNDWLFANEGNVIGNSHTLTNLEPQRNYRIHVTKICPDGFKGSQAYYAETLSHTLSVDLIDNTKQKYIIYPNPVSSSFSIFGVTSQNIKIVIYDVKGTLIEENNNILVNMEAYKQGLYFVKIIDLDSGDNEIKKLIKV